MKILIDIPTDQYNEIVYVNYERLRDIVRDGVVIEKCEDAISREAVISAVCAWGTKKERNAELMISMAEVKQSIADILADLPSVTPQIEPCEDCISILNRIMEYTYGMLTAEKIGLQHLIKSMMDELSGGGEE